MCDALPILREGDTFVVLRHDRLGRSTTHLLETIGELEGPGLAFGRSPKIDTTTPNAELVFHIVGALGQFERNLIRERTNAGLRAAAERDRKGAPQGGYLRKADESKGAYRPRPDGERVGEPDESRKVVPLRRIMKVGRTVENAWQHGATFSNATMEPIADRNRGLHK